MVENPGTWGHAEHVVNRTLEQHETEKRQGVTGLSVVRRITDALRAEGLLAESRRPGGEDDSFMDPVL